MTVMLMRRRRAAKNKGFNLIEAAIVLGIVGLVVGGIWVAATSVYANLRSKRATDELLAIAQGVRALYATSATLNTGANGTALTATAAQSNVLPSDTLSTTPNLATAANTVNPWGGNVAIFSAPNSNGTVDGGFMIQFTNVPSAACVDFMSRNSGVGRDSGMYGVGGGAGGAAAYAAAPVVLVANTALAMATITGAGLCNSIAAAAPRNVAFYFNLKG